MSFVSVTDKYAQPEVVDFWHHFSQQGLQLCEQVMLDHYAPPPARVLDLGCGSGRAAFAMAAQGYEVTSLDITWEMAQVTQRTLRQVDIHSAVLQADMQNIPFTAASYDVVLVFIAALQHINGRDKRQAALAEIYRVLRLGGVFILALDNIAPALTCYAWWGWRKLATLGQRAGGNGLKHAAAQADDMLVSRRHETTPVGWHMRGLARTLRWRTWPGLVDLGRKTPLVAGERGDTVIQQVSLKSTPGGVYYHLYAHDELLADAQASGLELIAYYSGRELAENKSFAPRARQLDKQLLYAFRRP